ncbi:MAG: tetratricopeptide (TPR) repeat protein [Planctomycetota bacterium]
MKLLSRPLIAVTCALALAACSSPPPPPAATSLLGEPLPTIGPDGIAFEWMQAEADAAHLAWQCDPSEMRAVWMGRRLAYMGRFQESIGWYANAIGTYPESYRLRRHMGHRLLTIREIDAAIVLLEEARELAKDAPNRLEPDGAPGPEWEPRSSTHGNIDYHLALAYYLQGEYEKAAELWETCAGTWARTDDERVAATHWAYMCWRRIGNEPAAAATLARLPQDPDVLENFAYADLISLYRGEAKLEDLMAREDRNAALDYGLARWMITQKDEEAGNALLRELAANPGWPAFGVLAAESDLAPESGLAAESDAAAPVVAE